MVTTGSTAGNVQVEALNSCGVASTLRTLAVSNGGAIPAQPSVITGPTTVCANQSLTYSVTAVSGVTYRWTLPTGWTGSSSTNSITVTTGSTAGNVQVEALNNCGGVSTARTLAVSNGGAIPAQPSVITGSTTVCANQSPTYSVTAVSGVTYRWTLPTGWTGSSSTNSITVTTGSTSGNVQVEALNNCGGVSTARTLAVSNGGAIPAQPSVITGPTAVCANQNQTYSVTAVTGVTYRWTLPSGWSGSSSTNSIMVTTGSTAGNVQVEALNSCGVASTLRTLAVSNGGAVPAQPGVISGSITLCQGQSQIYSFTSVIGATSYLWTLPGGWTGSSTTNSITVTAGVTGGTLSVKAKNGCGFGSERSINIRVVNTISFSGSGNWSNPSNWVDGFKPPNPLPAGNTIIINGSGECIMDVPQTISRGASFRVEPGKQFRVNGNLIIK
jgi:large repetitive protein